MSAFLWSLSSKWLSHFFIFQVEIHPFIPYATALIPLCNGCPKFLLRKTTSPVAFCISKLNAKSSSPDGSYKSQCLGNYRHQTERTFSDLPEKVFINLLENNRRTPQSSILTPSTFILKSLDLLNLHHFSALNSRFYLILYNISCYSETLSKRKKS